MKRSEATVMEKRSQLMLSVTATPEPEFYNHTQSDRVANINVNFSYTKDSCIKLNIAKLN